MFIFRNLYSKYGSKPYDYYSYSTIGKVLYAIRSNALYVLNFVLIITLSFLAIKLINYLMSGGYAIVSNIPEIFFIKINQFIKNNSYTIVLAIFVSIFIVNKLIHKRKKFYLDIPTIFFSFIFLMIFSSLANNEQLFINNFRNYIVEIYRNYFGYSDFLYKITYKEVKYTIFFLMVFIFTIISSSRLLWFVFIFVTEIILDYINIENLTTVLDNTPEPAIPAQPPPKLLINNNFSVKIAQWCFVIT